MIRRFQETIFSEALVKAVATMMSSAMGQDPVYNWESYRQAAILHLAGIYMVQQNETQYRQLFMQTRVRPHVVEDEGIMPAPKPPEPSGTVDVAQLVEPEKIQPSPGLLAQKMEVIRGLQNLQGELVMALATNKYPGDDIMQLTQDVLSWYEGWKAKHGKADPKK